MRFRSTLAMLALALSACGADPDPVPVDFQPMWTEFPGSFPAGTYVFRNQSELAAAWATAPQDYVPVDPTAPPGPIPMPSIDFGPYSVVGVSLGVGIRCYAPHITQVVSAGGDLTVLYVAPPTTGPGTFACRHLWPLTAFARVPAIHGTVRFELVSE